MFKKKLLFVVCLLIPGAVSSVLQATPSVDSAIIHLSTSSYTTGEAFTEQGSLAAGTMVFEVTPKPGNAVWTSIKSCIGLWPKRASSRTSFLRTTLKNMDTGETYFWNRNTNNDSCTKETFDIPVHTHHRLKLTMVCYAPPMPPGETDFCKGFVILSSSKSEVMP